MVIDWTGEKFLARCSFEERVILRRNFWQWDHVAKRWWTDDVRKALVLRDYATPAALDVIQAYEKHQARAVSASFATDSDRDFPAPEGLAYLPYQKAGIVYGLDRRDVLIADQPGLGKGHPITTRVHTPDGWRLVADLKIGDQITGSNGQPTFVTGIFDRGVLPVYRVRTNDDRSVVVDGEHLWSVWSDDDGWITRTTIELLNALADGEQVIIPTMSGPAFRNRAQAFARDPYTAGMEFINPSLFHDVTPAAVPERYSEGSIEQRTRFLAGIIRGKSETADLSDRLAVYVQNPTTNAAWIEEIRATVESLGGLCFIRTWHESHCAHLSITLPEDLYKPICGWRRGRPQRWKRLDTGNMHTRTIVAIEPAGRDIVRCLSVAAANSLYVTEGYIVTHNTIQAIGITNALKDCRRILVVCPATLKINWLREVTKWSVKEGLTVGIAHARSRQNTETNAQGVKVTRKWTENVFPDTDVVIINYEQLALYHDEIRARSWHALIVDEAHALMNEDSERTRQILGGRKKKKKPKVQRIGSVRRIFLTGTPMTKRPRDMWPIIKACDPNGLGKDWMQFAYRYCEGHEGPWGFRADGATNLEELNQKLRRAFMVRRLKDQVLKELPPKMRQVIELPSDGLRRQIDAEMGAVTSALNRFEQSLGLHATPELTAERLAAIADTLSGMEWEEYADKIKAVSLNATMSIDMLAQARQDLALAKLPMVVEHVNRLLDADEQPIVFAYHKSVIKGLTEAFPNFSHVSGMVPPHKRQREADRFQDGETDGFIGQIQAAGTGLTLTRSRIVVFAEIDWLPSNLLQAEDRAHRIGQLHNVLVQYLLVENSLDLNMIGKILERLEILAKALDLAA